MASAFPGPSDYRPSWILPNGETVGWPENNVTHNGVLGSVERRFGVHITTNQALRDRGWIRVAFDDAFEIGRPITPEQARTIRRVAAGRPIVIDVPDTRTAEPGARGYLSERRSVGRAVAQANTDVEALP